MLGAAKEVADSKAGTGESRMYGKTKTKDVAQLFIMLEQAKLS